METFGAMSTVASARTTASNGAARRTRPAQPVGIPSIFSTVFLWMVIFVVLTDSVLLIHRSSEPLVARNLALQILLLAVFWWWSTIHAGTLLNAPFVFVLAIFFWH